MIVTLSSYRPGHGCILIRIHNPQVTNMMYVFEQGNIEKCEISDVIYRRTKKMRGGSEVHKAFPDPE
jgi:hypothetical protein